jgi:hypothetical protein
MSSDRRSFFHKPGWESRVCAEQRSADCVRESTKNLGGLLPQFAIEEWVGTRHGGSFGALGFLLG